MWKTRNQYSTKISFNIFGFIKKSMSSFFVEKNPPPPKPASLPPSIHPTDLVWAPEQIQGAQTTGGFGRTQLCLEPMDRLVVFTLNPWGLRYPGTFWKHPEALALSHGFWWVGNQPSWLICWFGAKGGSGIRSGKNTQGFQSHKSFGGDSRIPNYLGPQFTFSWNMEPAKKKCGRWCSEIQLTVIFLVPSFPFQGCTLLLREGKGGPLGGRDWKLMKF